MRAYAQIVLGSQNHRRLPPGFYDVNVTPDKRDVFLVDEVSVVESIKSSLQDMWEPTRNVRDVMLGAL